MDRVTPGQSPFTSVGIDCFGPLRVRRGRSLVKRYGVIFTCLAIRAVHIEVAHSLETDSFLMALRRFTAKRGQVKEVRSKKDTNLTGGERELRKSTNAWNHNKIHEALLQKSIKWNIKSPYASHYDDVWERCIRTTRKVLRALLQTQTVDDERLMVVRSPQFQVTPMIRSPLRQTICFFYARSLRCPLNYSKRKTPSPDADGDSCGDKCNVQ